MARNVPESGLSRVAERAALLVAADDVPDEVIAGRCRVARRTLTRWKKEPAFVARVAEHRKAWRDAITAEGIADRMARIAALNDRWHRMQRVIEARATEHAAVPGGDTGLLVRQVKVVRSVTDSDGDDGPRYVELEEYAVDTGLLRELREHEKQAAQDLGQWSDKHELDATNQFIAAMMEYGRGARTQ